MIYYFSWLYGLAGKVISAFPPGLIHLAAFRWRLSWAGSSKIASFTCLGLDVSWGILVVLHVTFHLPVCSAGFLTWWAQGSILRKGNQTFPSSGTHTSSLVPCSLEKKQIINPAQIQGGKELIYLLIKEEATSLVKMCEHGKAGSIGVCCYKGLPPICPLVPMIHIPPTCKKHLPSHKNPEFSVNYSTSFQVQGLIL